MAADDPFNLQRFIDAQEGVLETALSEIEAGRKQSHWMWFIFPQLAGLGRSPTAQFYGISSRDEAQAFLDHSVLGARLRQVVEAAMKWSQTRSADQIFGAVDAMKMRSSLTLFDATDPSAIFGQALLAFFDGPDQRTLALLQQSR